MDWLHIEDRQTGRIADIPPPLPHYLAPGDLAALEQFVRTWRNVATQDSAEQVFDRMSARDPAPLVYGLLWLTALWSALSSARIGVRTPEFIAALGYSGLRRDLAGTDEQTWEFGEQAIRRGVLAVVTNAADVHECLRIYRLIDPTLLRLRGTLLTIMDGLSQDMERNGIAPWGAATHIIREAGW